ncbi:CU044_5270 family protein [Actinomadura sp. NPDC000600]|uniref:CU044_5270 family protein n=1 Tax=Actinomadura sp. NPDC000600 TaxID=3154262 RepID=UPI003397FBB4
MDELTKVREFRKTVPPMSAEAEESVRRGLRALAAADGPAPRPAGGTIRGRIRRPAFGRFTPWVLPTGAILAASAVAGVVILHDSDGPPRPTHASTALPTTDVKPFPDVRLASAVELGSRAAHAAERQPYRKPGPKQWVYTRAVSAGGFDMSTWWKGVDVNSRITFEDWHRVDGGGRAHYFGGKLRVFPAAPYDLKNHTNGPLFNLGNYDTLPTAPGALLHRLSTARYPTQVGETSAEDVFETMDDILRDPSPPKLRAAVYRALPKVEGVTLRKNVRDAAGRPGVAFARTNDVGEQTSIILDPTTYAYLGSREDVVYPHTYKGDDGKPYTTKPGTVLSWYAEVTQKIVDRPGART